MSDPAPTFNLINFDISEARRALDAERLPKAIDKILNKLPLQDSVVDSYTQALKCLSPDGQAALTENLLNHFVGIVTGHVSGRHRDIHAIAHAADIAVHYLTDPSCLPRTQLRDEAIPKILDIADMYLVPLNRTPLLAVLVFASDTRVEESPYLALWHEQLGKSPKPFEEAVTSLSYLPQGERGDVMLAGAAQELTKRLPHATSTLQETENFAKFGVKVVSRYGAMANIDHALMAQSFISEVRGSSEVLSRPSLAATKAVADIVLMRAVSAASASKPNRAQVHHANKDFATQVDRLARWKAPQVLENILAPEQFAGVPENSELLRIKEALRQKYIEGPSLTVVPFKPPAP